jgi:hypothetical protein
VAEEKERERERKHRADAGKRILRSPQKFCLIIREEETRRKKER